MTVRLHTGRLAPRPILIPGDPPPVVFIDRFWTKVEKHDEDCPCCDGCWHWTAGQTSNGYGAFSLRRRPVKAHRFSYELSVGPIPSGHDIDHLCFNRLCVNPSHLEPVPPAGNSQRMRSRPGTSSRYRGVTFDKARSAWYAQAKVGGRNHRRGPFNRELDAARVAVELRRNLMPYAIETELFDAA